MKDNYLIWITGISGVGKTTFANKIYTQLKKNNSKIIMLDGDNLRNALLESDNPKNYSKNNRLKLAKIYSNLCKSLYDQNFTVIIATISLFREIHDYNRIKFKNYCEIYLKRNKINSKKLKFKEPYNNKNIVGSDIKIEEPVNPHFIFKDMKLSNLNYNAKKIVKFICK